MAPLEGLVTLELSLSGFDPELVWALSSGTLT